MLLPSSGVGAGSRSTPPRGQYVSGAPCTTTTRAGSTPNLAVERLLCPSRSSVSVPSDGSTYRTRHCALVAFLTADRYFTTAPLRTIVRGSCTGARDSASVPSSSGWSGSDVNVPPQSQQEIGRASCRERGGQYV